MELTKNDQVNLLVALETLLESCDNELNYITEMGYQNDEWSIEHRAAIKSAQKLHDKLSEKFKK